MHNLSLKISISTVCRQLVEATKQAVVYNFIFTFIISELDFCHFLDKITKVSSEILLVKHTAAFFLNKIKLSEYALPDLFVFSSFQLSFSGKKK